MRESGVEMEAIDTAKAPPTPAQIKAIVTAAGGVGAVLNTRHKLVKERGWVAKPPSLAAFTEAVIADVNVLRRPIILDGGKVIIGFDKAAYGKLAT